MKRNGKGLAKYIGRAKALGAKGAKIIRARTIAPAEWVRLKCKFGCGGYGHRLTCPPRSPAPAETREMLRHYGKALLVHGDNRHTDVSVIVSKLEREIFLDGFYRAFAMGSGPCRLCKECAEFCRHPEQARPAMEACGIDVYKTVRANGFPINVVTSEDSQANYYGVVLIE